MIRRSQLFRAFILGVLLLLAEQARAQIVSDHTASAASTAPGTSLTWSHVVGNANNRVLIVGIALRIDSGTGNPGATTRVTAVTFNSIALTCLAAFADNNSGSCGNAASGTSAFIRTEIWYLLNPAVTTANIVVTTNNSSVLGAGSSSYSGVLSVASGGVDGSNNGVTGSSTASLGPVTTPANALVVDALGTARSVTVAVSGTGHSKLTDVSDTSGANFHVRGAIGQDTAASPTLTWPLSGNSPWALAAAVLNPIPARRKSQSIIGASSHPETPTPEWSAVRRTL